MRIHSALQLVTRKPTVRNNSTSSLFTLHLFTSLLQQRTRKGNWPQEVLRVRSTCSCVMKHLHLGFCSLQTTMAIATESNNRKPDSTIELESKLIV